MPEKGAIFGVEGDVVDPPGAVRNVMLRLTAEPGTSSAVPARLDRAVELRRDQAFRQLYDRADTIGRHARQRSRRVVLISPGGLTQRGGIGQMVANLTAAWADRPDRPAWRVLDPWGPGIKLLSPAYWLVTALALLAIAARGRVGLLHIQMSTGGSFLRKGTLTRLGSWLGIPVIVHLHGGDMPQSRMLAQPAVRRFVLRALEQARFVVVPGEVWREFVVSLGVGQERVVVIPSGVVDPGAPTARGIRRPVRLLFAGRLEETKGVTDLLQALADPRLRPLDWQMTFAGDGGLTDGPSMARRLGIEHRCDFRGWVDRPQLHALLATSDVFVLPSRFECFPVAMIEAMAHGLAIVITSVGAVPEAITDQETGLLVPPGDPRRLADALVSVLSRPDLRGRLQRAARKRYEREYTATLFADRVLSLYHRCASTAEGPQPAWIFASDSASDEIGDGATPAPGRATARARWSRSTTA
jgi:glycosyltransferase involved in cell wall biosynthesis